MLRRQDRSVFGPAQRKCLGRRVLDVDDAITGSKLRKAGWRAVLCGIIGIKLFKNKVLVISVRCREPPSQSSTPPH